MDDEDEDDEDDEEGEEDEKEGEDGGEEQDAEVIAINGDEKDTNSRKEGELDNEQKKEQFESTRSQSPRSELQLNVEDSIE